MHSSIESKEKVADAAPGAAGEKPIFTQAEKDAILAGMPAVQEYCTAHGPVVLSTQLKERYEIEWDAKAMKKAIKRAIKSDLLGGRGADAKTFDKFDKLQCIVRQMSAL